MTRTSERGRPRTPTRRSFLKGAGASAAALVLGVHVPFAERAGAASALAPGIFDPNVFLRIDADNTVTILSKHFEMGQGITTGLATLVAEELEADWSQMRVAFAPNDPKLYNNLAFGPHMLTGGSTSLSNSWEQMRKVGAAARIMLATAAASRWGVRAEEIAVANGVVSHPAIQAFGHIRRARRRRRQCSCAELRRAQGPKGLEADRQAPATTRFRRQDHRIGQICARRAATRRADRHGAAARPLWRQSAFGRRQVCAVDPWCGRRRSDSLRHCRACHRHMVGDGRTERPEDHLGYQRGRAAFNIRDSRGVPPARKGAGPRCRAAWRCRRCPCQGFAGAGGRIHLPLSRARADGADQCRHRAAARRRRNLVRLPDAQRRRPCLPPRCLASHRSRSRSTPFLAAAASAVGAIRSAIGSASLPRLPRRSAAGLPCMSSGPARTTSRAATTARSRCTASRLVSMRRASSRVGSTRSSASPSSSARRSRSRSPRTALIAAASEGSPTRPTKSRTSWSSPTTPNRRCRSFRGAPSPTVTRLTPSRRRSTN